MIEPNAARISRIRARIADLVAAGGATAALDGKWHDVFPTAIVPAEGDFLHELVVRERPAAVLEIGLGYGFAALNALAALIETRGEAFTWVTLDPNQDWRFSRLGAEHLAMIDLPACIELIEQPSELALPRLLAERRRFDLAIVDGNHRFDAVFLDLFYCEQLVVPGGVIFLDDYQLPGIAKAIAFWVANLGWTLESVSAPDDLHQWAVLRTSSPRRSRRFDEFMDF